MDLTVPVHYHDHCRCTLVYQGPPVQVLAVQPPFDCSPCRCCAWTFEWPCLAFSLHLLPARAAPCTGGYHFCGQEVQLMGTAGGPPCMPCLQALPHRTDGKLYKLQTPQTPLARTARYDQYCMDEFPNGTNMVVAVLAYTGDSWA